MNNATVMIRTRDIPVHAVITTRSAEVLRTEEETRYLYTVWHTRLDYEWSNFMTITRYYIGFILRHDMANLLPDSRRDVLHDLDIRNYTIIQYNKDIYNLFDINLFYFFYIGRKNWKKVYFFLFWETFFPKRKCGF